MPLFGRLGAMIHKAVKSIKSGCTRVAIKIKRAARKIKCKLQTIDWDRLLRTIKAHIDDLLHATWAWIKAHPYLIAVVVVCVIIAVAVPLVYGPVLGAAGFSAAGPVAGSWAAGTQAAIGPVVAAGSAFAILQSAAMGGYGAALFITIIPTLAAVVAGVAIGVAALFEWL